MRLGNLSEFFSFYIEASEEIWMSICWGKQELARTCRGKTLRVLKLAVIRYPNALGGLAFIGVQSRKHTVYCATKLVSPYVFFFSFRIARSQTVWVAVIFLSTVYNRAAVLVF